MSDRDVFVITRVDGLGRPARRVRIEYPNGATRHRIQFAGASGFDDEVATDE